MSNLYALLKSKWFLPAPAERLAAIRIATGTFCLWYLLSRYDMLQRMVKNADHFDPVGLLAWMEEPLGPTLFTGMYLLLIALNICYILGLKFKITGPVFAIIALLFFTYRNSWSMIYHNRNALVLHILIIGLVASADAWSLDAYRKKRKGMPPVPENWRYGWPIMLLCAVTVGSYFLSGMAKVAGDLALDWANGSAMRSQIAVDALRKSILGEETSPLFGLLYKHTWLFLGMGIFTFILELGAPLVLVRSRWGRLWALLTLGMHWGIFAIMGISFRYQMTGFIFLSFFTPEKWFLSPKQLTITDSETQQQLTHRPLILFDGVCNLCNSWVRFVLQHEQKPLFHFSSLQSKKTRELLHSFGVQPSLNTIFLVQDNKLYQQSDAILLILNKMKFPVRFVFIFILVPRFLRNYMYGVIAKYRYQWFGKKEQCALMEGKHKVRFLI